jgi:hypothetical protein
MTKPPTRGNRARKVNQTPEIGDRLAGRGIAPASCEELSAMIRRSGSGLRPRRSRRFQAGPASAGRRKPPKTRVFSPAPRSPRSIRSLATITRSAACGAGAWRSPTPPPWRATPGAPRTRRRSATPGICAGPAKRSSTPSSRCWKRAVLSMLEGNCRQLGGPEIFYSMG